MAKTVLVINPRSANGRTAAQADHILSRARALLGDVEARFTERMNHATELTASALDGGASCIIAVGGDGTNNEVINGFFRPDGTARNPEASFSFLPRGTGGDFRRTFGWGKEMEAALARAGRTGTPADVGRLEFLAHDGTKKTRHFINIAGAGLSGIVDRETAATKGWGSLAFIVGSLKGLAAFHPYQMRVVVDGNVFHDGRAALCTAANGKFFGGGMRIAPLADVADGLMDVVCLPPWSAVGFVARAPLLFAGDILKAGGVKMTRGKRIEMTSPEEVLLDVDGEQPGRLPATFTVLPGAVRLCR